MKPRTALIPLFISLVFFSNCTEDDLPPLIDVDSPYQVTMPSHFPEIPTPADNELTVKRVALGKKLFYDKILSLDNSQSCGSCHKADNAFSDPRKASIGVNGDVGTRNAMALINLAWEKSFFWDGRAESLEAQALLPIEDPTEMASDLTVVIQRLLSHAEYPTLFDKAYGEPPSEATLAKAIASFERTLVSGGSRYDKYEEGDTTALTESEKRGRFLVMDSHLAECNHCHVGFNFTDYTFHNTGLDRGTIDPGRLAITGDLNDEASFKVPTLRNIALTGPYMHDGRFETLEEAVAHYVKGGEGHHNQSPLVRPFILSDTDKEDIVNFLKALTDEDFISNPAFRED